MNIRELRLEEAAFRKRAEAEGWNAERTREELKAVLRRHLLRARRNAGVAALVKDVPEPSPKDWKSSTRRRQSA